MDATTYLTLSDILAAHKPAMAVMGYTPAPFGIVP